MWLLPQWARLKTVYLDFLFSFEIPTLAGLEWAGECVCRPGRPRKPPDLGDLFPAEEGGLGSWQRGGERCGHLVGMPKSSTRSWLT